MIYKIWVTLISIIILLNPARTCDNFATISVKENIQYPSANLLDVASRLHEQHLTSKIERDVYLTDFTRSKPFTLNNGILSVSGHLDREQICKNVNTEQMLNIFRCCNSMCCMYIGVTTSNMKTEYIKVDIEDENDNEPVFPQQSITLQIHENIEVGYNLVIPKAEDLDSQKFKIGRYDLIQDENCAECFQIKSESRDGGPILLVKTKIDREQNSIFHLLVHAIDNGIPAKTGTLSVIIEVIDVNDNYPRFEEKSLIIQEEENGESGRLIRTIKVTDADIGVNSQITYIIEDYNSISQNHFRLNHGVNGVSLLLLSTLDYEDINQFYFKIVAKDHGTPSLSSTMTVNIKVTNINDEPPEIVFFQRGLALDSHNIILSFPENSPKQQNLILIHVTDKDSKRSDISCEVSNHNDMFYLHDNQQANIIENKKHFQLRNSMTFDRESQSLYRITILCSDSNGLDKLSSSVKIQLRLTDINDNAPIFRSTFYFGKILETNNLDTVVDIRNGFIKVTDADINENCRITFSLADIDNSTDSLKFSISSHFAKIKNIAPIDFEEKKRYIFLLVAKDNGNPVLSTSATITVNVVDANDNIPEISPKSYLFSVLEEQPIGTEIGRIEAIDNDSDPNNKDFIYEIVYSDVPINMHPNKLFYIENNTGRIRTRVILDREKDQNINFLVKVRNTNDYSISLEKIIGYVNSVQVNVKIIDINDNSPRLILRDHQRSDLSNHNDVTKYPIIYVNNDLHLSSNPCSVFPYVFTDSDDGINAEVRVSLRENPHFRLDVGYSLICPKTNHLSPGPYFVYIIGEDRNGGNGSKRSEFQINIIVKHSNLNKQHTLKKTPKQNPEEKASNYRVIIIFIVIILIIIITVVVIKLKLWIPKNITSRSRRKERTEEKLSNNETNKDYNIIIPGGSCDKRLRNSLNLHNVINSDYSNNLFYPGSFAPVEDILHVQYPNECTPTNVSQSNGFMFAGPEGTILVRDTMNPMKNMNLRYEQLQRNSSQSLSGTTSNWNKSKDHQYNYLLEPKDSSSLSSDFGKVSPTKQDIIAVTGYQKSINDIYLQTSFV